MADSKETAVATTAAAATEQSEEAKLKEEIDKAIKGLDLKEKLKAIALRHYYEQKKKLDEELEQKIRELTIEFEKKAIPLYDKQNEIIGGRALTADEIVEADTLLADEERNQKDALANNTDPIKEFWLRAFKNNDILAPEIQEKDEDALKALKSVQYKPDETGNNFELIFTFGKNDYFKNTELRKKFIVDKNEEPQRSEGTEINWEDGKNLTVKTVKKTQKNKKSGAKRTITKVVPDESFFNFFKDSEDKDRDGKDDDDDEDGGQEERIHIDYDVARTLVDEIIPYSVEYFLGVKQENDDDGFEDDDDDEDGNPNDDDDNDDSAEDEPVSKKDKKKKHKKSSDSGTGEGGKGGKQTPAQECKQQ